MGTSLAETYAEFAAGLSYDAIPERVRRAAMWHIVDALGVTLAATAPGEDTGEALRRAAERWESADGGATVVGTGQRLRPETAALVNGSLGQALEMDDKHGPSLARPGSTVIPAALAVAEADGRTVHDLVTAVVAGYEVMIRLGFVGGKRFLARGYHTSSLLAPFGSAAAIGRLNGLDPARIVDAFGIAGTFASGIQESTRTGATSKILHGGWGAHGGIIATDLASAGITGPASVFEGDMGFFFSHLSPVDGELDWARGTAGLGEEWLLPDTAVKPYPCCQLLHSFIDGMKDLRVELAEAGLGAQDIERIDARLAEPGLTLVTQPLERKLAPQEAHEARFSLPFVVAHTFVHGEVDVNTFTAAALRDETVRALALKVVPGEDPDSDYPAHDPADIDIVAGGRTFHRRVAHHPGSPERPLLEPDILAKFERNTAWALGEEAGRIGTRLAELDPDEPAAAFIGALAGAPTLSHS
ncbi:MAG TPA: MmgE/PrpD family protein [Gryllotalpicola sp.]